MRFHVQKAAAWALLVLCATGCADDGATSDQADETGEATRFDAGVVTSDASAVTTPSAGEAGASSASDPALITDGDASLDAGRAQRPDAGTGSAPADAGRDQDAASDAAARDAGSMAPSGDAGTSCPAHGSVTYTLQEKSAPSSAEAMAYAKIRAAMDKATEKYNCYTNLAREVHATYEPGVATADGSTNGSIRFGSDASMHFVTAMHELSHVFGVGSNQFKPLVQDGVFTGPMATAEMRRVTGDATATVKSDGTHFWPYGLNYVTEYKSEADLVGHCALVVAIRKDIGL